MKRIALLAAALTFVIGAAHAAATTDATPTAKKSGNDCIFIRTVGNYRVLDTRNVVIWAPGRRDAYLVELSMPLFGLQSSPQIAMIDNDHDGRLCGFSMDKIGVRDIGRPESSSIRGMKKLDDAGLTQLEEKYDVTLKKKPKKPAAGTEASALGDS